MSSEYLNRRSVGGRLRIVISGSVLAVLAGALVDHGSHFGAELTRTAVVGLALGAVLGLVRDGSAGGRALGFGVGFAASWVGFALRAGALPDIPMGRALAAVIVIALITAAATASAGRLPLWAGLLGAGTLAGAYETTFAATPTAFTTESTTAATTAIFCVALGFLVSVVLAEWRAPGPPPGEAPTEAGASAGADREIRLPSQRQKTATTAPSGTAPLSGTAPKER